MRYAKAALRLVPVGGRTYNVELKPSATWLGLYPGVELHANREDCKPGPVLLLALDEAQAFLRSLQSAVDEAYRRAKVAHKEAR